MKEILQTALDVADSDIPILIGVVEPVKKFLHFIHKNSQRANNYSLQLIVLRFRKSFESELFGH